MIEEALFTRLSGFGGLTALVGTRVFPLKLPPGTALPAVSFQLVDAQRDRLGGQDGSDRETRFQFDSWAGTYESAKAVAAQVVAALDRWSGTVAGVVVTASFIDDERDTFEEQVQDGIPRVLTEATIWHDR